MPQENINNVQTGEWSIHGGGASSSRVHTGQDESGAFRVKLEGYVPGALLHDRWDEQRFATRQDAEAAGIAAQEKIDERENDAWNSISGSIAVRLTDDQARKLLADEHPALVDPAGLLQQPGETLAVANPSANVQYSRDEGFYFALLQPTDKAALDERLTRLLREDKVVASQLRTDREHER